MKSTAAWPAMVTAVFITWGATAYNYINTGFSIAMIVFVLFAAWTLWMRASFPKVHLDKRLLWAFGTLYGALFFVTLFHLDDLKNLYGGYFSAVGFLMYTIPFWMILYVGWDRDIRKPITATLYVILYALCLYGIGKYIYLQETRLSSFYFFPTRIGMMLDMFIPFTAALTCYYWKHIRFRILSIVLIGLEIVTLLLAQVRGSLVALSVALFVVVILWLGQNRHRVSKKVQWTVIAGSILFILAAVYVVTLRWGNSFAMVGGERLLMWESSYHMWLDHPIAGIGLNAWQAAYAEGPYHPAASTEIGQVMPHNVFVYFFATGGTIGGIAYIAYCIFILSWLVWNVYQEKDNPFSWAMIFMFVAVTAHGLTDQTFILKLTGRIFYLLLGTGVLFLRWRAIDSRRYDKVENNL